MEQVERHNSQSGQTSHRPPPVGVARGHWWSSSRGQTALLALSSCLVELLPVEAWLLVLAGSNGYSIDEAGVPFWLLCLLMGVAWLLGARMRGRRAQRSLVADLLPFGILYVLALCVSPAAFAGEGNGFLNLSWIGDSAAFDRPGVTTNLILIFMLLAILWWRGTVIAAGAPASSVALRRFGISLGLLLLAVVGLNAVQPDVSDPYGAALTLLIIGEVFCGLLSAALSHLEAQRHEGAVGERNEARWIGVALLVDVVVVLVALCVSLIFNFQSFLTFLGYLGPVGQAIGTVLSWLLNLLVAVLGWLLTPLLTHLHYTWPRSAPLNRPPAYTCGKLQVHGTAVTKCNTSSVLSTSSFAAHLVVAALVLVVLSLLGVILYLAVRRALAHPMQSEDHAMADEREALGGRTLFAAQLRELFGRSRRRIAPYRDPLQRGTVRYMYRDVLRAAASRGLERQPPETPDEYARRLTGIAPLATSAAGESTDLRVLSDAYDAARYADREPDESTRISLHERVGRLIRLFGG